ncbi:MAG: hypothetical protein EOP06_06855 [Proteobacteria bacterium]|nr:MAG: hypothetical protein EOP06_06855 [Pseudomonadota bacterium]
MIRIMKDGPSQDVQRRGIALLMLTTFVPAAYEKLKEPAVPKWFLDQFAPTLLGAIPETLPLQFYVIALLEVVVAVVMVMALLKRNNTESLRAGLGLAFVTFLALGFGQRISHKFDGAAQLFAYAGLTWLFLQHIRSEKEIK